MLTSSIFIQLILLSLLPVPTGSAIIGTIVMNIVAKMYIIGKNKFTWNKIDSKFR